MENDGLASARPGSSREDEAARQAERLLLPKDRAQLVGLLRILTIHLTSAIESAIIPGTDEPGPEDQYTVTLDRRDRQLASEWIKRLEPKKIAHVEPAPSVDATRSGEAKP
jgi:hypothetical protein